MITIIAAIGRNNELGKDNKLLWKIPEDMKFFKEYTTGKTVIMGRKTFESIGRPLPNRRNIVISSSPVDNAVSCSTLETALNLCKHEEEIVIIGGAQLYKSTIDIADRLLITRVHSKFDADAFFPEIDFNVWNMISSKPSCNETYAYSFIKYEKNR